MDAGVSVNWKIGQRSRSRLHHRLTNWKVQNGVQEALRRLRWELAQASREPQESREIKMYRSDIILAKKKVTDLRSFPNPNIVNLKITH